MALGLLMCDRESVAYDKPRVDLAFMGAWRSWGYRDRFPQVNTDLSKGSDGLRVMTRADQRKRAWNLYWETSEGDLAICARATWDGEDIDPTVVADQIDGDVPPAGWRALAEGFLERFDR